MLFDVPAIQGTSKSWSPRSDVHIRSARYFASSATPEDVARQIKGAFNDARNTHLDRVAVYKDGELYAEFRRGADGKVFNAMKGGAPGAEPNPANRPASETERTLMMQLPARNAAIIHFTGGKPFGDEPQDHDRCVPWTQRSNSYRS